MANLNLKAVITAEDKASSTVKSFASNLTTLSNGAKTAATSLFKIGTVAGAALTAAGGFALKSASDVQMLRTNLDTLTGSAEKGAAMFDKLYKMAAKTPFETQDLVKASSTLLAFGVAQEKILPTLQMLGDVSLGNKVKFEALSLAYAQVQSTGKLMGQDLLQMVNQGFNPLQIISEKTGKSMSVLKDEMSKGAISADMVTEAFKIATSEGGRFYEGMDKGSKTLQGTISTLQDNITMLALKLVGLSETGDVVKGGLFDKVSEAVNNLNTYFETHKAQIDSVAVKFGEFINKCVEVISWLNQNRWAVEALGIALLAIAALVGSPIAAIGLVVFALYELYRAIAAIGGFWKDMWNLMSAYVQEATVRIRPYINSIVGMINTVISGINKIPGVKIGAIPKFASGGVMQSDGLAYLHKGETVVPRGSVTNNNGVTVNIYGGMNSQGMSPYEVAQTIDRQIQLSRQGAY